VCQMLSFDMPICHEVLSFWQPKGQQYIISDYIILYTILMLSWYIQVYTSIYCDILVLVCRTPFWLSLLIHTASWKTIVMYPWKTVGMLDSSSSSLATYAQLVEACWMAGVAAMCMGSTSGCGSLDRQAATGWTQCGGNSTETGGCPG
jgi:hypothetical protein